MRNGVIMQSCSTGFRPTQHNNQRKHASDNRTDAPPDEAGTFLLAPG
jgi:hypothetical protein